MSGDLIGILLSAAVLVVCIFAYRSTKRLLDSLRGE